MAILVVTSLVVPYRLAFVKVEPIEWAVTYYVFDLLFLIDMLFCFFTSYKDELRQIEITSHKLIAKNYLMSWFAVDFFSIFPFD
jgi:potassium channel